MVYQDPNSEIKYNISGEGVGGKYQIIFPNLKEATKFDNEFKKLSEISNYISMNLNSNMEDPSNYFFNTCHRITNNKTDVSTLDDFALCISRSATTNKCFVMKSGIWNDWQGFACENNLSFMPDIL